MPLHPQEARNLPESPRASEVRIDHPPVLRRRPLRISRVPPLAGVLAAAACAAGSDEPPSSAIAVGPAPAPTGEGSETPFLSPAEDGILMSWLEPAPGGDGDYVLRMAHFRKEGWNAPVTVSAGEDLLVNWADFPSVTEVEGSLVAHWLLRGDGGGYDYGVRVSRSVDGGATWSDPWTPHVDGTATEHGFVSVFPSGGATGLVWLDGRRYAVGPDGAEPTDEMTLRFRTLDAGGGTGPEILVDGRVCDCCQTDAASTSDGPVVVYRNRSPDEIRDIHVTRLVDGRWTDGVPVHEDGWHMEACPVNGPAVAARDRDVVVAWFTGAGGVARVQAAFSRDAGAVFGGPLMVDDGDPVGRVDVVLLEDGSALASWIERIPGGGAEVRVRRLGPDGRVSASIPVGGASGRRASGFPRMARLPRGGVLVGWTDDRDPGPRVRVARLEPAPW